MARPDKCKRICYFPEFTSFKCDDSINDEINLSIVEYEVIYLIDYKNFTQEEAAKIMNVARTTITKLYADARKKIAILLIEGKKINIEGGNFKMCPRHKICNKSGNCIKGKCNNTCQNNDLKKEDI